MEGIITDWLIQKNLFHIECLVSLEFEWKYFLVIGYSKHACNNKKNNHVVNTSGMN